MLLEAGKDSEDFGRVVDAVKPLEFLVFPEGCHNFARWKTFDVLVSDAASRRFWRTSFEENVTFRVTPEENVCMCACVQKLWVEVRADYGRGYGRSSIWEGGEMLRLLSHLKSRKCCNCCVSVDFACEDRKML